MNIVSKNILSLISKPVRNLANLHISFVNQSGIKQNVMLSSWAINFRQKKMFFSTIKETSALQNDDGTGLQSNLPTYIKNATTIEILQKKGIKSLFPIQIQTFEAVYQGRDLLASDRTGSGKTIAYSLPIIEKLRDKGAFKSGKKQVKFLVMCPTRQLTLQVYKEINTLRHGSGDFNVVAVYGGSSIDDQIRELRNGVDVVVATPGRLMDLIERRFINFTELEATCIDEADQMLEKGFKLDIEEIFRIVENQRKQKTQNLMFSATIPEWVDKISSQYMDKTKKKINLISKSQTQTSMTVEHLAVECPARDRINCIQSLIKTYNPNEQLSTIIFSETKLQVTDIAMEFGKNAAFLQGDMDQKEREFNLNAFRNGKRKILIATDVASRGLDIDNVGLVIQLQPPRNTEPFIHRAGRTGRAGKKGICITLFDKKKNLQNMIRIEHEAKITFKHIARPRLQESEEIWQKRLHKLPHTLKQLDQTALLNEKIELMADTLLSSHIDVKQLIKRHLVAIVGEPPINHSVTTQEAGYKTYAISAKQQQAKMNSLAILNFIKTNFEALKVTNVHVQSNNIIFDIPEASLIEFRNALKSDTVKESVFAIKEATSLDREMMQLRDLAKGRRSFESNDGRRMDGRGSGERTFSGRNDRNIQMVDGQKKDVFIPNLPFEIEQQDLEQELKDLKVEFESIRLRKKSQTNVFAFVSIEDPESIRYLLKNGININGNKIKAFIAEDKGTGPNRPNNNRNNSFGGRPDQGYDRRNRNEGRREQGREDRGGYFDKRSSREF